MEVKDSQKDCTPKILQNTKNNCPVNGSRRDNKLTNNMNNICNIWTSNNEINQAPNNNTV